MFFINYLGLLEMTDSENQKKVIPVYYSPGLRIISLVGVPALTVLCLWMMSLSITEVNDGIGMRIFFLVLGAAGFYQCVIGWRTLPYLRARLLVSYAGLEFVSGGKSRKISWGELAAPKHYTFATITCYRLKNGEVLIYAFDNMENIEVLEEFASDPNDPERRELAMEIWSGDDEDAELDVDEKGK